MEVVGGSAWVVGTLPGDFLFFVLGNILRRELIVPLGAYPPRRSTPALAEGAFAGTGPPRGFRREQTLGEGYAERKGAFAETIPALCEDPESGSAWVVLIYIPRTRFLLYGNILIHLSGYIL
jgi:hypothetical protein